MTHAPASIVQGDLQDQKITGYQSPLGVTRTHTVTLTRRANPVRLRRSIRSKCPIKRLARSRPGATTPSWSATPCQARPTWRAFTRKPGVRAGGIITSARARRLIPDKFFVICSNVLGGCDGTTGPLSPCPQTGRPFGMDFPPVTVRDMVAVQAKLIEHLGIPRPLRRHRRFDGRNAGAGLGGPFPGARPRLRSDCDLHFAQRHANCVQ